MKNILKLIGIISLAAVIGFSFAACGGDDDGSGGGGDPLANQLNGTWETGNGESITLNNGSFVISENNKQGGRGTYKAAVSSISTNITMAVNELHGDYLNEIEDGPTFERKWYTKNQVIDVFRKWLKETSPGLSDKEISDFLENYSYIFDAMFPTITATIADDNLTMDDGTKYTKTTSGDGGGNITTPAIDDFIVSGLSQSFDGNPKTVTIAPKRGKSTGAITVYYNGKESAPSAIGTYSVTFDVAAANGWKAASGLNAGTLTIAIPVEDKLTANTWANGDISSYEGEQWFSFTATAVTQYIHVRYGTLRNMNIQVYNSTGATVEGQAGTLSDIYSWTWTVTSGQEYYVKVTPDGGYHNGTYRIAFNTTVIPPVDATLAANTWANGDFSSLTNEQWFSFTATAVTQYIHVTLSGLIIQVYDSTGATVEGRAGSSFNNYLWIWTVTSGQEYYVKVTPYGGYYNGTYRIAFNTTEMPPVAVTTAVTLTYNTWASGNFSSSDDVQWFRFIATDTSQVIHVMFGTKNSMYVDVYNSDGAMVGNRTNLYTYRYSERATMIGQEYYMMVKPSGSYGGKYRILVNSDLDVPPVPLPSNAATITANTWINGTLTTMTDEQWFRYTETTASQFIHIDLNTKTNMVLTVYNSNGREVGGSFGFPIGNSYFKTSLTSGQEYYILVMADSSSEVTFRVGLRDCYLPLDVPVITLTTSHWEYGSFSRGWEDWFRFTATAAWQYIFVNLVTIRELHLEVYDSSGNEVSEYLNMMIFLESGREILNLTIGQQYYIKATPRITSAGVYGGSYRIAFSSESQPTLSW